MAKNNEFVIDVGARLNKKDINAITKEIEDAVDKLGDINKIILKADISEKEVNEAVKKIKNKLKNDYKKKINITIDNTAIKQLNDFEKRIGYNSKVRCRSIEKIKKEKIP